MREKVMFMLQCDEYQESYDDEQREMDWREDLEYEQYLLSRCELDYPED